MSVAEFFYRHKTGSRRLLFDGTYPCGSCWHIVFKIDVYNTPSVKLGDIVTCYMCGCRHVVTHRNKYGSGKQLFIELLPKTNQPKRTWDFYKAYLKRSTATHLRG